MNEFIKAHGYGKVGRYALISVTDTGVGMDEKTRETILIAEDEEDVRELTKIVLEGYGYTVIEAVDGEDAIDKFRENKDKIRLLLFDVIMPNKNGREAYDAIKEMRPDIKVLFMSGYSADIVYKKDVPGKGFNLIAKPVSPTELLKRGLVTMLLPAAEFKDTETGAHILRMGQYAQKVAQTMGMPVEFVETITFASPMHDVGKIGIPDSILLKAV